MDVGDAVELRQPFIQEGIVGGQQIHHAAVFLHDTSKEEFSFFYEVVPQVVVKVWKQYIIGLLPQHVPQPQPLSGEICGKSSRATVLQHTAHLSLQDGRFLQLSLARYQEQFVVGKTAPEKER